MNKMPSRRGIYTVGFPGGGVMRIEAINASEAIKMAKESMKIDGIDLRGRGRSFKILKKEEK